MAMLEEGQWALGGEFGLEEIDMEACGKVVDEFASYFWTQRFAIEDYETRMFFGNLAYGVCDEWEVFVRFGAADGKGDIVAPPADSSGIEVQDAFDGDFGLAWGVGSRATFCRSGPWSVGGLVQVTWFQPGDSDFTVPDPLAPGATWIGDVELDYWQTQTSLAVAYQADTWQFWFGPFLQFVEGDMDFDGQIAIAGGGDRLSWTSELRESAQVGAHFGTNWELASQLRLWAEGQVTTDSWLFGVGVVFASQESFGK